MRFQVLSEQHSVNGKPGVFFQSDELQEAKAFAMRMAFFMNDRVRVYDEKCGEIIHDFDDPKHR